ncbi:uncharacterized protein LOC120676774 [Panicum virgatum]|uniref:uncharacterized protein LOC120676774 n=1 Tax=Panicum virgatum TaxID=38727 RepID=UPI0019D4F28B|nr:uncharacterized protein LOC120676774 [Panicum virgatum]
MRITGPTMQRPSIPLSLPYLLPHPSPHLSLSLSPTVSSLPLSRAGRTAGLRRGLPQGEVEARARSGGERAATAVASKRSRGSTFDTWVHILRQLQDLDVTCTLQFDLVKLAHPPTPPRPSALRTSPRIDNIVEKDQKDDALFGPHCTRQNIEASSLQGQAHVLDRGATVVDTTFEF